MHTGHANVPISSARPRALTPLVGALTLLLVLSLAFQANANADADATAPPSRAHWLDARTVVWPGADTSRVFTLHASSQASLEITDAGVAGGEAIALELQHEGLPEALAQRFPHLVGATTLRVPKRTRESLDRLLRGQLLLSASSPGGSRPEVTGLQLPGVLDELFAHDAPLGVTFDRGRPTFQLWAPTARKVTLLRFADSAPGTTPSRHPMARDEQTGTWSLEGARDWNRQFYRYEVEVYTPSTGRIEINTTTDPYSLSLAADSARSQVVDLRDGDLAPEGWESVAKPPFTAAVDAAIYELHVRDFSLLDERVPAAERGTFRAFRHTDSLGMRHLARLQAAGMTHVHLLPVFDIATVPERRADQRSPEPLILAALPPDSSEQQAMIAELRDQDGFNWGYDPWHYTVPEGSYATDPDGVARIVEFREMVQSLNALGLRVVMDVVYNHTHAAGRARGSVLDQLVPGYYQRLDAEGAVETSTCCANTATEHRMMERLMIDSVLAWARDYRVDGFRFDLMGHHSRDNMLRLREALDGLSQAQDGVDGKRILLYGEGWNFGEVANDARFIQARQGQLAGTGIGTFSDRLRDGARGGLYNSHPSTQGFLNGLGTAPTRYTLDNGPGRETLLQRTDWIRVGLAGDLAAFRFVTADGRERTGAEVDYNGSPAAYTASPAENISYVAAHDNETLFDINQLKLPPETPMEDRVRVQTLGNALVLLGQGVPFIHAGQEFLRSKSLDRNSYNAGDWFNAIDWRFERGNWGRGLPMADENAVHWDLMRPLLADPALAPAASDRRMALADFEALLRIRGSSPLFRLGSLDAVQQHLAFHNTGPQQQPGLIVMTLSDPEGRAGGPWRHIAVLFNARPEATVFTVPALGVSSWRPHPDQPARMSGRVVEGRFEVPARSVAVFVSSSR